MFSDAQLRIIVTILVSAGEVFLASLVVPFFTGESNWFAFVLGVTFTVGAWLIALFVGNYTSSS